jgi:cobalt-precorrin 5A hydrolase
MLYLHEAVLDPQGAVSFPRVFDLVAERFGRTDGFVFIGPIGVMVRALAPHIQSKLSDFPVVVVDVGGRYAISLLSGHESGANELALAVANILRAEPIITTTTEAAKNLIIGIGCRRGCPAAAIIEAFHLGLESAGGALEQVRYLASADIKAHEPGLLEAARELSIPLRFIPSDEIRACTKNFNPTPLAQEKVNLPAVAEPAALLAGRRTTLVLPKVIHNHVTVAVARECCL